MDEPEHHCCHGEAAAEVESGGKGKVDVPASVSAWVCPMCPSVREPGPGACPMCGMALESEEVAGVAIFYTCPMHADVQKEQVCVSFDIRVVIFWDSSYYLCPLFLSFFYLCKFSNI